MTAVSGSSLCRGKYVLSSTASRPDIGHTQSLVCNRSCLTEVKWPEPDAVYPLSFSFEVKNGSIYISTPPPKFQVVELKYSQGNLYRVRFEVLTEVT
jgi:hypothetical protein